MVTLLFTIFVLVAMRICNRRLNKRNQETLAGMSEQEKETMREKLAFSDLDDRSNVCLSFCAEHQMIADNICSPSLYIQIRSAKSSNTEENWRGNLEVSIQIVP